MGKKKKKKSKKNYGFEDEEEPLPEPVVVNNSGFDGFEDMVEDGMQMTGKKKKKKKKKKKNFGFMDEHEATPDEDEEDENDRFKKKSKKVMSKRDIKESQMNQTKEQIKLRQIQQQEVMEREMKAEQERKKLASINKSRSRNKKKGGGFTSGAFEMMLAYSDSEPEEEEEEKAPPKPRTPTPPPVKKEPSPPAKFKKKKKGKGKKGRKQQKQEEEDLDALLAGFNQGSPATEELKSVEVKKEPEPPASVMPAWALEFDEDDMMIFKRVLKKAKDFKTARRKLIAGLDLEIEQAEEAWALKDQILAEKVEKAAPPPPPKEPTPPPAPKKVDLKKKKKREEQKRRQKLKKIRPRLDQSKASLNEVVKTTVENMHKHYVKFINDPVNGYTLDVPGKLTEVIAPFTDEIEEAFEKAQSAVKGDGVLFEEMQKKLESLMKGKETWNSYRKLVLDTFKKLEEGLKAAIEAWVEEEKRLRKEREEKERLEKQRKKLERKEQKKRKEEERKRMEAEQRRKDFEARFGVGGRGGGGAGTGRGRGRKPKKKSKFALAREAEQRREKEMADRIAKEKEERERKRKEEEEKAKRLEEESRRAEEEARKKRIAELKRNVQRRKSKRKDSSDDSDSDDSFSDDSDAKPKKKKKKKPTSSDEESDFDDESDLSSKLDSESESESKSSSEEDFSDASDESVAPVKKPPPKPQPKPKPKAQVSSSPSTKNSPPPEEKKKEKKKGKKKLSKKEKRALKEAKQKERLKNLRAPIGCIMGHVDAGKTLILDNIRKSKVAEGESGGITQQIGATFLPKTRLQEHLEKCRKTFKDLQFHLPGILMIDTPGHAAFHNMRTRGSNLCDIAIVAIDIFDADRNQLQPTTIEALKMLKSKKTPFVIAMNKIDMINGWEVHEDDSFTMSYAKQSARVKQLLEGYLSKIKLRFAEQEFNVEIYTRNKNKNEYISLVPTSAFTGEGIADILCLLSELCQTYMAKGLQFVSDKVRGSVLETKKMVGIGNVCDVILANGELRAGDEIVLGGLNGAFVTKIKSILLPSTLQEMRVKGEYKTVPSVTAAAGVRIQAANLEQALAGSKILVVNRELKKEDREDEIDRLIDHVDGEMETLAYDYIDASGVGVFLQANTLGAMEALLEIVKTELEVPISGIRLGDISKADVMKASVANEKGRPEFACILGFMVQCPRDVELQAEASKVTIFQSDVIYRLQLQFKEYLEDMKEQRKIDNADEVVFPVEMEIMPKYVIRTKKPVVLGCRVLRGMLRVGTPIVSMQHDSNGRPAAFHVGKVESIQREQKDIEKGDPGDEVAVRFNSGASDVVVTYGRHFDHNDKLVSAITRGSLDKLKELHADEIKEDKNCIKLIHLLKNYFDII